MTRSLRIKGGLIRTSPKNEKMVWVSGLPADIDAYEPWSLTTLPLPALKTIRG